MSDDIELMTREAITARIDAERSRIKRGRVDEEITDQYDRGRLYGLSIAASIARGTTV